MFGLISFVAYWNGYEVGDIRTARPTFNNLFVLEKTSDSWSIVSELRKQKGISQTDLASQLGIHKNVLGKYERNEVYPSIDLVRKIADILDVSLDYLTGKDDVQIDKDTSSRILEVSKFEEADRNHIFSVIYTFIAKRKIQMSCPKKS